MYARAPNRSWLCLASSLFIAMSWGAALIYALNEKTSIKQQTVTWLRLTAAAFYNDMQKMIEQVADVSDGLSRYRNVGRSTGRGVQLEVESKRQSGLGARASYSLSDGQDDLQHTRLTNSPMHLVKLNMSIPASREAFVSGEMRYTSTQRSYQNSQVPSLLLADFTASTKPMWGGFQFSAGCYDCLDRQSFSPGLPELVQQKIPMDGRTVRFKVVHRIALTRERKRANE